jgi:hypothetical protein
MPHYDFFCHACRSPFSKALTPAEYEEGTVVCPTLRQRRSGTTCFSFLPCSFVSPLHPSERSILFAQASVCLSKERTGNIVQPCSCFQPID